MPANAKTRVEYELFIRSFMSINPSAQVMNQFIALMRDAYFEPGEVLYEQGQPAVDLHFIVTGQVELHRPGSKVWVLGDESILGIIDANQERAYARTAIATKPTHSLVLRHSDYMDVLEDNFDHAMKFVTFGAGRNAEVAMEQGGHALFDGWDEPIGEPLPLGQAKGRVNTMTRLLALRSTPVFSRAPVQALASLAEHAIPHVFQAGERVFSIGEPGDAIHVLLSGRVKMSRPSSGVEGIIAPTRVLGGLAAFGNQKRVFHADTTTESIVLEIQKEDLFDVMEDHFGLLRSLLAQISVQWERMLTAHDQGADRPRFTQSTAPPP